MASRDITWRRATSHGVAQQDLLVRANFCASFGFLATQTICSLLLLEVGFCSWHSSKKPHPFNSLLQLMGQLIWT
jgi:hypothetical protein